MPLFDLCSLEIRESQDLPARTLVAPLSVIREIRASVGRIGLDLQIGLEETVLVSPDVFAAFSDWDDRRIDDETCQN